ncbi:glycosyltransferase involved in cell wall biosynthesis [Brevundimonas vesicularis]|uniref:glycosyltransferase family 4 protein n=1 Tax=Brevundimonas vesicularis TaxID=41276 RepID=UPI002780F4DF|nr:glycosyltransferase family 4 protein [Brevundimonas vesicularis]MDQ1192353.1 glycosyltransferase involved in cell wall biosynthesis [Brevundimonas vesicularis]
MAKAAGAVRVLIVNTLYPPAQVGGAERSVAQLAQGLRRAGAEASVLTLTPGREPVNEWIDGVPVQRLSLRNLYWPYDGVRRSAVRRAVWHGLEAANPLMDQAVDRAVARVRPDLIHLHLSTGFSLSVYHAAARRDLPLVQTLRDWSMLCARASLFRRGRRCERRCRSCVLLTAGKRVRSQAVGHVIGLSGPVLETHRAAGYFRRTPGSVIGNAAGAAAMAPKPSLIEAPTMRFGFLGRVEPEKGIEVLLAATRGLGGDWSLNVAGRGEADYVQALRRAYDDPRIIWLGQVEAEAFWPKVDVLVAPAVWAEPFGRSVVEAVQQGRGVIASRIGGLAEAAQGAGMSALIEPGDAGALTAAMQAAVDQPGRWRFAAVGAPAWTEASIVEAHRAVYRQVLSTRSSMTSAERDQA